MIHWYFGWTAILLAFLSGGVIGVFFHDETFCGGYASFRRRMLRLGHIALAALGMINLLYSQSSLPSEPTLRASIASAGFLIGGAAMPLVCFLTSWRPGFKRLFFIPVVALVVAAILTLRLGPP